MKQHMSLIGPIFTNTIFNSLVKLVFVKFLTLKSPFVNLQIIIDE